MAFQVIKQLTIVSCACMHVCLHVQLFARQTCKQTWNEGEQGGGEGKGVVYSSLFIMRKRKSDVNLTLEGL